MPASRAMAAAVAGVVAGEHHHLDTLRLRRATAARDEARRRIGDADQAEQRQSVATPRPRSCRPASASVACGAEWPRSSSQAGEPSCTRSPSSIAVEAACRPRLHDVLTAGPAPARPPCARATMAAASGCVEPCSRLAARRSKFAVSSTPRRSAPRRSPPAALRQVPVLSTASTFDASRPVPAPRHSDENAGRGALPGADHDRRRRRQPSAQGQAITSTATAFTKAPW
jgi:hypothetical protein